MRLLVQPDEVVVFVDDGAGALDPSFGVIALPPGTASNALAAGDVDGDGLADLLVGDATAGVVHVMRNVTVTTPASFSGVPGTSNCFAGSIVAVSRQFRGQLAAAAALGYPSVAALHAAIREYCEP